LHLFPTKKSGWTPTTATCSSYTHEGIPEVWDTIEQYFKMTNENQYFDLKRKEQNQYWMFETINEQLKLNFYNHPEIQVLLEENKISVQNGQISPFTAAMNLLGKYFK
jgi:LAO/AO transport system kinase